MKNTALIPAAGSGTRMGSKTKKQFLKLAGQPLLTRTVLSFENNELIDQIILVVPSEDIDFCQREIVDKIKSKKIIKLVEGGATRAHSVFNGLKQIKHHQDDIVLIHDGARPFLSKDLVVRLIEYLRSNPEEVGVIPIIPVKDTIKIIKDNRVDSTPKRDTLFAAQTPQCFYINKLIKVFGQAQGILDIFTDESSMVEYYGYIVQALKGEEYNIKITTPQDLAIAEFLIREGILCLK